MLVRFDSDVGGFSTFGDVAEGLLKLTGHSGTIPGAILAPDVAGALERLEAALAGAPRTPGEDDEDGKAPVGLHQRAFPFIGLLRDAAASGSDVRWRAQ